MAHVIVAEDHEILRDGLRRILEAHGQTVIAEIGDGLRVVDAVERNRPDLVLLDLGLPGLHGLDIVPELKKRAPHTRVLVLSAESRDDFVLRALRSGAAGYLLKSCSADVLLAAVAAVTHGRTYVSAELADTLVRLLGTPAREGAVDPYDTLSHREREVFHLMAEGFSNAAIAERLFVSPRTVESHRANVLRHLGLKNQTDVVRFAVRRGIIEP